MSSEEVKKTKMAFEKRIAQFSADSDVVILAGPDHPLEVWWRYILWAQRNGVPKFVKDLCQRCLENLMTAPRLLDGIDAASDERLCNIWLKVANSLDKDRSSVYEHMYREKIAWKLALFYTNWAEYTHLAGNVKFAVKILKSGLRKEATPKEKLLECLARISPGAEAADTAAVAASTLTAASESSKHESSSATAGNSTAASSATSTLTTTAYTASISEASAQATGADPVPNSIFKFCVGWEQSPEETRFLRWCRQGRAEADQLRVRLIKAEKAAAAAVAAAEAAARSAAAERERADRLAALHQKNLEDLEKGFAAHLEATMKKFHVQLEEKEEEIKTLHLKLKELAARNGGGAAMGEGGAVQVGETGAEKRDQIVAMLTPKGPMVKRQSSGEAAYNRTGMASPTINARLAQAQVLALFNHTLNFAPVEPSIVGADASSFAAPLPAKGPLFDEDKENRGTDNAAAATAASATPFAIFKDPTEKLSQAQKLAARQRPLAAAPANDENAPSAINDENAAPFERRPFVQAPPNPPFAPPKSDFFSGDVTSFNPPESSTVNVASIQGVKSVRQLCQDATVKFNVPVKALIKDADEEMDDDGHAIGEIGDISQFVPPSSSTRNWNALAKAAQQNPLDDGREKDAAKPPPREIERPARYGIDRPSGPPPAPSSNFGQYDAGLIEGAGLTDGALGEGNLLTIYEVSKEFSQISVGSNHRFSSSSSSSSSGSATALSKSGGAGLSRGRFAELENLKEVEEEEDEERGTNRLAPPEPHTPGFGRLKVDDHYSSARADDRSHALLVPTTPGAPVSKPPAPAFVPFSDEEAPAKLAAPISAISQVRRPLGPLADPAPFIEDEEMLPSPDYDDDEDYLGDYLQDKETTKNNLSVLFNADAIPKADTDESAEPSRAGETDEEPTSGDVHSVMDTHMQAYEAATFNLDLDQTVALGDRLPEIECTVMIDSSDPWSPKLIESILAKTGTPLEIRQGYVELEAAGPSRIVVGKTYNLGGEEYVVEKQIGEGGFAKVFAAVRASTGKTICLKFQKPACPWEFYVSTEIRRRLKRSGRSFRRDDFMNVETAYFSPSASYCVNELGKGTLLEMVNAFKRDGPFHVPESLALLLTLDLLVTVERLHSTGIIHADVKPDNFLFVADALPTPKALRDAASLSSQKSLDDPLTARRSLIKLIDFGRCIDLTSFPAGTNFMAKVKTDGYQCQEMIEGRPWTFQLDLFGLVSCVYVVLRGDYPKWKRNQLGRAILTPLGVGHGQLRGYRHPKVWQTLERTLIGIPDCDLIPDLKPLIQETRETLAEMVDDYEKNYETFCRLLRQARLV